MFLRDTRAELREDGTLEFSFLHGSRAHFRMQAWCHGLAAFGVKREREQPTHLWSMIVLPLPGACRTRNPAVEAFVRRIPAEAQKLARPYQFGQCVLLHLLATLAQTEDLAKSNPNLLWLLVAAAYDGRVDARDIGRLCVLKQTEILRVLTRAGSKSHVKLLRKVAVVEGSLTEARDLHAALCEPEILASVRHLAAIPAPVLSVLTAHPALARDELVRPIAAKVAEIDKNLQALDALSARLAALGSAVREPALEDVRAALDPPPPAAPMRVVQPRRRAARQRPRVVSHPSVFPAPPLAGTSSIVPITSAKELEAEGAWQRHCVGGYARSVYAGDMYIYRVLAPERATLQITLYAGVPEIGQLKLVDNREPSAATVRAVREWFFARKG